MKKQILALVGAMAFLAGAVVISHAANSDPAPNPFPHGLGDALAGAPVQMAPTVGPTSCVVYMRDDPAEITFSSSTVTVQPLCPAWVKSSAAYSGELWIIGQPPGGTSGDQQVCHLKVTGNGDVVHAVVHALGGASAAGIVSESYGKQACTSLLSSGAGWVKGH